MGEFLARPLGVGSFQLGESPVRLGDELVFIDLEGRGLHRAPWDGQALGALSSSAFAQRVCCAAPAAGGGLLVALESRIEHVADDGVRTVVSTDVPGTGVRLNDGGCDPAGRFFVGLMGYDFEPGLGALLRLDGHRLTTVLDGLVLPNGMDWSPDGTRFYLADSMARHVLVHAYDPGTGTVGERLATIDLSHLPGYPDGLTVDTDGRLWVAFWDGGAVRCLDPDGTVRHEVPMPVPDPTCAAFLEPGLLVVTTAIGAVTPPGAGDLFLVEVPATGLPTTPWRRDGSGDAAPVAPDDRP